MDVKKQMDRIEGLLAELQTELAGLKAKPKTVNLIAILDDSVSMAGLEGATIEGFNSFLATQRADRSTNVTVSLTVFSTAIRTVYSTRPIDLVRPITAQEYRAQGASTRLNDAVYDTLQPYVRDAQSDEVYVVLIITDGLENDSKRATKSKAVELIQALEARGNWSFSYIGAAKETWTEAKSYNVSVGSTIQWVPNYGGVINCYNTVSDGVLAFRNQVATRGMTSTLSLYNNTGPATVPGTTTKLPFDMATLTTPVPTTTSVGL